MLLPIKRVAIFIMMIGVEQGKGIIELMDNDEIKAVVIEIRNMTAVSKDVQQSVWDELKNLGYNDKMKPSEILTMLRLLFNGSKISNKVRR